METEGTDHQTSFEMEYLNALNDLGAAQLSLTRATHELAVANELIKRYAALDSRIPAGTTPDEYEHLAGVLRG